MTIVPVKTMFRRSDVVAPFYLRRLHPQKLNYRKILHSQISSLSTLMRLLPIEDDGMAALFM